MKIDIVLDRDGENVPDESVLKYMEKAASAALKRHKDLLPDKRRYEISLSFVTGDEIRSLNNEHRGKDVATDVLSFPIGDMYFTSCNSRILDAATEMPYMLGDVVICTDLAEQQAEEYRHSVERELVYLFTHSVLHLIGMDHENEDDRAKMREEEEVVMNKIGLPR
jgi:probable rRNA maturation factor